MKDYSTYSFWLDDSGEPLPPRPPLTSSADVDVAILGAGYSGLWTAYYLLLHEPQLRVAVVEKEIAGFGASGRNGGWCSSKFPLTPGMLEKRFGAGAARDLLLAMRESVARRSDHESANRHGDASAGTEAFRELGNRTTALAGCALYAGRSSAHR